MRHWKSLSPNKPNRTEWVGKTISTAFNLIQLPNETFCHGQRRQRRRCWRPLLRSHMHKMDNLCDRTDSQQGHLGVSSLHMRHHYYMAKDGTTKTLFRNKTRNFDDVIAQILLRKYGSNTPHHHSFRTLLQTEKLRNTVNELDSQWEYQFTHILFDFLFVAASSLVRQCKRIVAGWMSNEWQIGQQQQQTGACRKRQKKLELPPDKPIRWDTESGAECAHTASWEMEKK